jgi:hypothetical protein
MRSYGDKPQEFLKSTEQLPIEVNEPFTPNRGHYGVVGSVASSGATALCCNKDDKVARAKYDQLASGMTWLVGVPWCFIGRMRLGNPFESIDGRWRRRNGFMSGSMTGFGLY